ncbi:hypothetical protein [Neorhizobium galegae]|uniref:hypothetical protein n=1 Tax=Neorhizobium galegae TaxID=399 RepID=UPI0021078BD5|nr:hypothetical protein [Neorhizobium galegae]MCQ1833370.1 hypothetical protein [Neorhizobium galegae]
MFSPLRRAQFFTSAIGPSSFCAAVQRRNLPVWLGYGFPKELKLRRTSASTVVQAQALTIRSRLVPKRSATAHGVTRYRKVIGPAIARRDYAISFAVIEGVVVVGEQANHFSFPFSIAPPSTGMLPDAPKAEWVDSGEEAGLRLGQKTPQTLAAIRDTAIDVDQMRPTSIVPERVWRDVFDPCIGLTCRNRLNYFGDQVSQRFTPGFCFQMVFVFCHFILLEIGTVLLFL